MRNYLKLSYNITADAPLYPGTDPVITKVSKAISMGDSCNTFVITFSNHIGTHIDVPKHFFESGRAISDYSLKELIFTKPLIIDCPKQTEEIIGIDDLEKAINSTDFDLLLIRTGFQKYRSDSNQNVENFDIYSCKNPCLSPKAAGWLRNNFSNIRAIGIDCISIASYAHRDLGRETHRVLLENTAKGSPVLIIEDLNLSNQINHFEEVIVAPLYIEDIDSAPCTVIGVTREIA